MADLANLIERVEKRDWPAALAPFTTFAEVAVERAEDGWMWSGSIQKERIVDWFGPSDFGLLLALLRSMEADNG